jgi:hypothetical protein
MKLTRLLALAAFALPFAMSAAPTPLDDKQVADFTKLALDGITREFPNKPMHVHTDPASAKRPRDLHPVFYGSFDWHSSMHGHWMLVRLLRLYPDSSSASGIREALAKQLTREGLAAEAAYFDVKTNRSYERMYGWAWALRLAAELRTWDDPDSKRWAENFAPLEKKIVELAKGYLPKLDWPIRCGFHPESAFPLGQYLDYAVAVGDKALAELVHERAKAWYGEDIDYPVRYEPSGNDFFSAGLNEADLMRRVIDGEGYAAWLAGFFPGLATGEMGNLLEPATVSDVTDGHLVHLAGLNLTRAWTMRGIASALPKEDPRRAVLDKASAAHTKAGLDYVFSGHYEGEHWLASFAIYLLTDVGVK